MSRERQFNLRLSDEELNQLRQLAQAHDRSINSYIRTLIKREVSKATIELPRKSKKRTAEYV